MAIAMRLAEEQVRAGAFFVHEHPQTASSWSLPCVQHVAALPGVFQVTFHQCCFGLRAPHSGKPLRKATTLMSNSSAVRRLFEGRRCACQEEHQQIIGSDGGVPLAAHAAHYPPQLCEAFVSAALEHAAVVLPQTPVAAPAAV